MAEKEDKSEAGGKERKKGRGFLNLLIVILKYVLFVVILAIFVVVVSIITVRALERQSSIQNTKEKASFDIQQSIPEELDWYSTLGEIRGNLLDQGAVSFVVDIYLGYTPGDQASLQELARRNVQLKERIRLYFTSQYLSDVEGAKNIIKMKFELREIINRMLNNKIKEVAFNNLQIIKF